MKVEENNKRFLSRLKSYYFSLYEVETELSVANKNNREAVSGAEYDYLCSLELRKEELENNIETLLKQIDL
jgi:hypothetical protein